MKSRTALFALLLPAMLAASVRADTVTIDGNPYKGTVNGIKDGKLSITIRDVEHLYDLTKIQAIDLDAAPKLVAAEALRSSDAKSSAALYKQVLRDINNVGVRQLVELRAIAPTEADGRFSDAVVLFLDVYPAHGEDAVWQFRPTKMPAAGSQMLTDAADALNAAIKKAAPGGVRRNLQEYLLEVYNRAGDKDAAARLATVLDSGIPEEPAAPSGAALAPDLAATLGKIDSELQAKEYTPALQSADAALTAPAALPPEAAVRLFSQKARALEGLNKPEDAAAAWLRIPAHYPTNAAVPAALYHAAVLEKSIHHDASAAALFKELTDKYPTSPEAAAAQAR